MKKELFNSDKAKTAQIIFCQLNELHLLAPRNGICPYCERDIYKPVKHMTTPIPYVTGITIDEAKKGLITSCPHCGKSYIRNVSIMYA